MLALQPVYLVGCSATKRAEPCAARDLYRGRLFRTARAIVELRGARWAILSAMHGLVAPETVLAPYEQQLPTRRELRRLWAEAVVQQLIASYARETHFVILAGAAYRFPFEVAGRLLASRFTWEAPLAGMGIGRQMQWMAREATAVPA